ncbi:putative ribonuclease H-like domain-containing protein [Tanacetum coccineum]
MSSPPYTRNFIPFKPDLIFMDEIVESENMDVTTIVTPSNVKTVESKHESANVKNKDVEPKTVRKNSFIPLIIEDWNSDDESEVDYIPNIEDKTVRPSTEKLKFVKSARKTIEKSNPQQKEYKEKGVIDSGCSRHMTGNKCYLTEYEDYHGGFVSFRDGKDTECLVLSSDFKLLDESQVLLRVPRKDNIHSVDLKSVVPTKGRKATQKLPNGIAERKNTTLIKAARTMDHLGKFDGKADEGFFVGYSVVSKAMRVFNRRTRIVEETLNIRFLENAPNEKEINTLLSQAEKDDRPEQDYILIPIYTTDPLISQDPKTGYPNSTNSINTVSTPISAVGPSFIDDTRTSEEHLFERFSPFKNAFTIPPVSNVTLWMILEFLE